MAIAVGVVALLVAGALLFAGSEAGLRFAIAQIERASGGSLHVGEVSGSLLGTIRAKRLRWDGTDAHAVASDVVLDWNLRKLWARRVAIGSLGIARLSLDVLPSTGPAKLPADLALPLDVELDQATVGRLDWRLGEKNGTITGLEFGYEGGAREHRLRDLKLVFERGALDGNATLGARPPFPIAGTLGLVGDRSLRDARADADFSGTLEALRVDARGRIGEADFVAKAALAPLGDPLLRALDVDAHAIDLTAFDATLPVTRVDVRVEAMPQGDGQSGTITMRNSRAGAWDAQRLPLQALRARFAMSSARLELSELSAELPGGARVTGSGRIPLDRGALASTWSLDLADVDLQRIYTPLVATRLGGRLAAELSGERQQLRGQLAQKDLSVDFAATVADGRVDVRELRARAGRGELQARGAFALTGERRFEVAGTFAHLDPSRFAQLPGGDLSGAVAATGLLQPTWRSDARVTLASGSRLSGVALAGSARGTVAPATLRSGAIDLVVGSGHVVANGDAGAKGDRLAFTVDAPRLAEWVALAPAYLPPALAGALRARGTLALEPGGPGATIDLHGEHLRYDAAHAADRVDAHVEIAPGGSANAPVDVTARALVVRLDAAGVKASDRLIETLHVDGSGTLAAHQLSAHASGEGMAADVRAHGSAREQRDPGKPSLAWDGTIDAFDNAGRWPFRLESPTTVAFAGKRLSIEAATLLVAGGRVKVGQLIVDDGRVTTTGDFTGVSLAAATKLAGVAPPFSTDLALGGEWSVSASPRWNGSIALRRESGDISVSEVGTFDATRLAFGISALGVEARIVDDGIDAHAVLRSALAGSVDATLALAPAPGAPPGQLGGGNATLTAALRADLATLRTLQPWLGTTAVIDGRAQLNASATGRLADPALSLALVAEDMRVDAPQYGLHLRNGRLRARDQGSDIVLEELVFEGGDGRFSASGTLASLRRESRETAASTHVAWKAENFRVLNRPDRRLVVAGEGTLGIEGRKVALRGALKAVQGHLEYTPREGATLSPDVVIVGGDFRRSTDAMATNFPLSLDVDVDLGEKLTFAGEGLETGLRGNVHVSTTPDGRLVGRGTIRAVNGTYFAFGQRLTIDRGAVIFNGPLDNPALDIVALRKNQAVEAGVTLTGTVKVPIVTLTSNPPVPDSEKLSWLVLGRSGDAQSGADAAALQAATAALLSRGGKPLTTQIAQKLGLDDISFGGAQTTSGTTGTTGAGGLGLGNQVVVFGKRISDRLSIAYQQGLTVATNALRLEYALTQTLTVRVEAGTVSSIGIVYRRTYD